MSGLLRVQGAAVNGQPVDGIMLVVLILATIVAGTRVVGPLFRAIAKRIEGSAGGHTAHPAEELDELRARVAELEAREGRLAELEERLDFTERVLAQRAESRPVGPG